MNVIPRFILLALVGLLPGCSTLGYYSQAINGHLDLLSREQPIEEVIVDPETSAALKSRLTLALRVREFASNQLALPDNDSYKYYADLKRPFAIWNVIATPAYSVEAKKWCYLIVGCLSYRGYFDKAQANGHADELVQQGYDAIVSGAAAYSTLGWMDDPLLNTIVQRSEASMIGIIFHELAHQVVYVDGDTAFNEAFATAVEYEGLRRWYQSQGDPESYQHYIENKHQQQMVIGKLVATRERLNVIYRQTIPESEKHQQKQAIFRELKHWYESWRQAHAYNGFDAWMRQDLNNAHLALVATYQQRVPNFLAALRSVDNDMPAFFRLVENLADKDQLTRDELLRAYKVADYAKHSN